MFCLEQGVAQGCNLSPTLLFDVLLREVERLTLGYSWGW